MTEKKEYAQSLAVILFFAATGFLVYYPVLGNGFLSDDYDSLYRICIEKRILYKEQLRPFIDISFYFNYLVSGLSPKNFYVFNVAIHVVNALLLYRFSKRVTISGGNQFQFAVAASFFFLIYPFHNESIAWLSGRLSSMACFFALLVLLIQQEKDGSPWLVASIVLYLVGLLCYESIIVLPLILLVLNADKLKSAKKMAIYGSYWAGATFIYLFARVYLSGSITGSYGRRVTDAPLLQKLLNTGKVIARLFLPPSEKYLLLITCAVALFVLLAILHVYLFRNKSSNNAYFSRYKIIVICLLASLLLPAVFGVSTRTSEGDRLLYFPSCFFCMLASGWVMAVCKKPLSKWLVYAAVSAYFICFLELNNHYWIKASAAAAAIMKAAGNKKAGRIVYINMPEEIEGAFVFRNGFSKALVLNNEDIAGITVFNYLKRTDYLKAAVVIEPVWKDSVLSVFPAARITAKQSKLIFNCCEINNGSLTLEKDTSIVYYWNKERLVRIF